jgi:hypothetical protein
LKVEEKARVMEAAQQEFFLILGIREHFLVYAELVQSRPLEWLALAERVGETASGKEKGTVEEEPVHV